MFLDDIVTYKKEQIRLFRMPIKELVTLLGELYERRVMQHDIEAEAHYRLAGWVLNQREKIGKESWSSE